MPIKIPDALPAVKVLSNENIFVMTEKRAITQDIRPLKLLLLNLMPLKIDTETQLSRLLGNTPLQIELEFICTKTHNSKNTPLKLGSEATDCRFYDMSAVTLKDDAEKYNAVIESISDIINTYGNKTSYEKIRA